jgi:imidazolonepropionase-like amidohydrolase
MEISMYVANYGMTIEDALRSATSVSVKIFGFEDRGFIRTGKRADLLLANSDLLRSLDCIWAEDGIVGVWKAGIKVR